MKKILALVLVCMFALTGMAMAETLKMGTNAAFPPYEFYSDETGEIVGIEVEIVDPSEDIIIEDLESEIDAELDAE